MQHVSAIYKSKVLPYAIVVPPRRSSESDLLGSLRIYSIVPLGLSTLVYSSNPSLLISIFLIIKTTG
ncbi:uncharacterized protein PHALS_00988 [Plasmopara halstedii]|uniref:Uncharacterized protein n=1 Tax=Plasmopara halstedii TaxID=4781 RepID=A0A0P1ASN8_PLAHL|nr:uncharacterized protein PHALS_00988 [Plasmopara halstedii]CEG44642.1 hypothetical protein PHALS_00988 [Plasmopara halstedii]|eukprot:XP_024581011.1 hypothetical protein PHALS_00988 [Plasmopara halstedii]